MGEYGTRPGSVPRFHGRTGEPLAVHSRHSGSRLGELLEELGGRPNLRIATDFWMRDEQQIVRAHVVG
jgi:hypothetical protein